MIKLVFGSKNKIIKLEKATFQSLNSLIQQSFNDIPVDYSLSYLDTDKDEICLNSDQDLHIMLNSGIKINKIYIKQSLSQAIEITDRIEPSFEIYEHKVEDKEVKDNTFLQQRQEEIVHYALEVKVQDRKGVVEEKKVQQQKRVDQQKKVVVNDVADVKVQVVEESVSKSYILNVSDTKIQLQESALNEKIFQYVKKVITNKQEESKIKQAEQKKEAVDKQQEKVEVKQEKREVKVEKEQIIKPQRQDKQLQKQYQQKKDKQQRPFLKKENISDLIYHNVICAQCNDQYGIIGIRYQCIFCERYDLCSLCEQKVEHEHSLLKIKVPKQAESKEQIMDRYRKQILAAKEQLPKGHYVPSISKDQAKVYLQAGKKMMAQSFEKTQNLMNDFFLKLQMGHKNPYEVNKPMPKPLPPKKETNVRQKIDYLIDFLGISDRDASSFCHKHYGLTKQQLLNLYVQKRANRLI